MKRVLKLIDYLHQADELFEHLMAEAKKEKREALAEELKANHNWFVRKVGKFRYTRATT